jgi:cysteinyl-tRNA synthetase
MDMPKALALLWELIRDNEAIGKYRTIKKMDQIFGLDLFKKDKMIVDHKIKKLIDEREYARGKKDWVKADEIREKIKKLVNPFNPFDYRVRAAPNELDVSHHNKPS